MPRKLKNQTEDPDLKEIRERYEYTTEQWKDIRKEAELDMRYLIGDPWEADAKEERKDAGRPMLSLDELNQYVNQALNTYRQNKRGIQIQPAGNQATDKTAQYWEDRIRGIEVSSSAQQCVYIPAFQSALERSYGFMRVSRKYVPGKTFDQEVILKGISNPDTVIYDYDVKEVDWSDADFCFVADPMRRAEFKRRWKGAKIQYFTNQHMVAAPNWVREDHVVVAEYWKRIHKPRKLVLLMDAKGNPQIFFKDELEEMDGLPRGFEVKKEREYDDISVVQQMTNGVEILEETKQPGTIIPIIATMGLERYVTEAGKTKRVLMSAIRLARDPQMLYNFLASQEAEEATMSPKTPFIGAVGQFDTDKDTWDTVHKIPHARVQYDAIADATGQNALPPPSRPQFIPNFQSYEVAKEAAKRAIQAAMGITPLPTAAQRRNEKSGKALDTIQNQEAVGNFHFTDNMDRSLQLLGRVMMEWGPVVDDTEREVSLGKKDGSAKVVRINTEKPYEVQGEMEHYPVVEEDAEGNMVRIGDHKVTINTGPSRQSEHEEAASYIDTLASIPQLFVLVADIATRMRNLGPLGDEIADRLTPPQFAKPGSPAEAAGKLAQAQQQMQAMQEQLQQAMAKLQELELEKKGRVIETQGKLALSEQQGQREMAEADKDREVKIAVAEISTKAQILSERVAAVEDLMQQFHAQSHEMAMQAEAQQHQKDLAAQQAQNAQTQQQTQIAADQQSAQQAQENQVSAGPAQGQ